MTKNTAQEKDLASIREEQRAFDSALENMLKTHAGKFALFKNGKAINFFPTYNDAYRAGLKEFGVDSVFLVSEVKKRDGQPPSISWCSGAMSVQT